METDVITTNKTLNSFFKNVSGLPFLVGGSYALALYLQQLKKSDFNQNSEKYIVYPNDIDIFVACEGVEDFSIKLDTFFSGSDKIQLLRSYEYGPEYGEGNRFDRISGDIVSQRPEDAEEFSKSIIRTDTYIVGVSIRIQLVAILCDDKKDFVKIMAKIVDIPTNVFVKYSFEYDEESESEECKLILFPQKTLVEGIERGSFDSSKICEARRRKYEERGFTFL